MFKRSSTRYTDFQYPAFSSFLWQPVEADYHPVKTQLSPSAVRETMQAH